MGGTWSTRPRARWVCQPATASTRCSVAIRSCGASSWPSASWRRKVSDGKKLLRCGRTSSNSGPSSPGRPSPRRPAPSGWRRGASPGPADRQPIADPREREAEVLPVQIRPGQSFAELREFGSRLQRGVKTLSELGDITVGATPKEAIYSEDKLVLYRFRPQRERPNAIPVLIVYALVNRPYMVDLQEDRSIVRSLLQGGLDVYLIDWGYPDAADRYLTLDDYINGYIDRCVDVLRRRHGVDAINLLGVC